MNERLAILETIAIETRTAIQDLRQEMRVMRSETRQEIGAMRSEARQEIGATRSEILQTVTAGFAEARRVHDRDFRMTWGALIAGGLGLMYLLAHTAHWL